MDLSLRPARTGGRCPVFRPLSLGRCQERRFGLELKNVPAAERREQAARTDLVGLSGSRTISARADGNEAEAGFARALR